MPTPDQAALRMKLADDINQGKYAQITEHYAEQDTSPAAGGPLKVCFLGAAYRSARLTPPLHDDCPGTMARKRLRLRQAYGLTLDQEENLAQSNDQGSTFKQLAATLTAELPSQPSSSTQRQRSPKESGKPSQKNRKRRLRERRRRKR